MKHPLKITLALCLFASGTLCAWADEPPPVAAPNAAQFEARLHERFAKADVNADGQLTLQEAQAGMPRVAKHFNQIDTEHKGYITFQQLRDFVASRAAARASRAGADTGTP